MATKARKDHYVAETYLRHFAGPLGMLRAYRKSDGTTFPCWPELNPLGETTNHGQLGCVIAPGCCAAARGWFDSNSIGDR